MHLHSPKPGNFVKHARKCRTCLRISNGKNNFQSSKKNSRHFTCESTHLIYLVRYDLCSMDNLGQTTQSMRKRHLGHRGEILSGADGLRKHLLSHGQNSNLKDDKIKGVQNSNFV